MSIGKFVILLFSLPLGIYCLYMGTRIFLSKEYYVRDILKVKDKPVDEAYNEREKWIDNRWAEGIRASGIGLVLLAVSVLVIAIIIRGY